MEFKTGANEPRTCLRDCRLAGLEPGAAAQLEQPGKDILGIGIVDLYGDHTFGADLDARDREPAACGGIENGASPRVGIECGARG